MTAQEIINQHNKLNPESSYFGAILMKTFGDTVENFKATGPHKVTPITPTKKEICVWALNRIKPVMSGNLKNPIFLDHQTFRIITNVEKIHPPEV